jgi:hypothetical protein
MKDINVKTLDIKPFDTIVVEFNPNEISIETLNQYVDIFRNKYPKNHIVFLPNCLSISSSEGIDTITKWIKLAEDAIDRIKTSII